MIEARLKPLNRELEIAVRADLSPAEQVKVIATIARDDIATIDAENDRAVGADVQYDVFVDGRKGAALEAVKPDGGTIAATWRLQSDVVDAVWVLLRQHSPVLTGRYRQSHALFADGVEIDPDEAKKPASEFVFISTVPYARKIERGASKQAADGVYESVAAVSRGRFGNLAQISFGFRSLTGAASDLGKWASGTTLGGHIRNDTRRADWLQRQPAIIIRMK